MLVLPVLTANRCLPSCVTSTQHGAVWPSAYGDAPIELRAPAAETLKADTEPLPAPPCALETYSWAGFAGPVGQWLPAVGDAFEEVLSLDAEAFGEAELGSPHVAGAVADHGLESALRIGERDSFVIDLDLLAGLEVVIDDHLACAPDQRAADLERGQPVDVVMSDQTALEIARQVGQVDLVSGHMRGAGRCDRNWSVSHHIVHDGQVVDGEIPQHVDIPLKQPQVDPR